MRTAASLLLAALLTLPTGPAFGQASSRSNLVASQREHVLIRNGYAMMPVAEGLDYPSAIAFSGDTTMWVSEAGQLPGVPPKVKQIHSGQKTMSMLAKGKLMGPLTDVTFHDGMLWITHRQMGANGWAVGAISKFDPQDAAGTMRLEAWGFRNPYGIGIDPMNPDALFASNNGADTRGKAGETSMPRDEEPRLLGQQPIEEDYDDLFKLGIGDDDEFFGWPDYFHGEEEGEVKPVTASVFCGEEGEKLPDCPGFVLAQDFRDTVDVSPAFAQLGYHTSANKFDFSASETFGSAGRRVLLSP